MANKYDCCRHGKVKKGKVRSMDDHNRRTERGRRKNHDPERAHLNDRLFDRTEGQPIAGYLRELIEKTATKPNRFGKTGVDSLRSDSPWCGEVLCFGSPGVFDDPETLRKHSEKVVEFGKKEFGDNLLAVDLHMDEGEPHWHLTVAAVSKSGKWSLKEVFGGPQACSDRQTRYWETCGKPFGLDRGEKGSKRKHTTNKEYHARMAAAERDADELMAEIENPPMVGKGKWREETRAKIRGILTQAETAKLERDQAKESLRSDARAAAAEKRAEESRQAYKYLERDLTASQAENKQLKAKVAELEKYDVRNLPASQLETAYTARRELDRKTGRERDRKPHHQPYKQPEAAAPAVEPEARNRDYPPLER